MPPEKIVSESQRDEARVHQIAEVLVVHAGLDHGLLELRPERMDRVSRRVIGQREDTSHRAREGLGRCRRLHQRERDLLLALAPERDELVGREDETGDDGRRPDEVERDLQLDRHGIPLPAPRMMRPCHA